ncbi:MAG: hypothetical protein Ta2D_13520 [Rickettsiales bacterium]|nr:MAG: hypothetical protein Ta2D_13520 [Rickettsiales bacterium]
MQERSKAANSWEITGVNEMLTQMENHKYPFVCTTNLIKNLDQASLRRFIFKIEYKYLKPEQVNKAFDYFFKIKDFQDTECKLNCLSPGDFVVVKKKAEFLKIKDKDRLMKMLEEEQKIKKDAGEKRKIGFEM